MKRTAAVILVSVLMIAAELFSGINGVIEKNRPYEFELHRELIEKSDTRYIERLTLSTIIDPGHFALSHFSFGMYIEDFNLLWNSDCKRQAARHVGKERRR